jgi:hypothetical protein
VVFRAPSGSFGTTRGPVGRTGSEYRHRIVEDAGKPPTWTPDGGGVVNDTQRIENAAAAREAAEAAGRPHARGSRAGDIEAGLMRYLAAEQYHEKVEETRAEKGEDEKTGKSEPGTAK